MKCKICGEEKHCLYFGQEFFCSECLNKMVRAIMEEDKELLAELAKH
jgi:hypothetical protein